MTKLTPRSYTPAMTTITTPIPAKGIDSHLLSTTTITQSLTRGGSAADLGATTSFLRPEGLLTRSARKLVIGPQFHAKATDIPVNLGLNSPYFQPSNTTTTSTSINTPMRNNYITQQQQYQYNGQTPQESSTTHFSTTGTGTTTTSIPLQLSDKRHSHGQGQVSGDPTGLTPMATRSPLVTSTTHTHTHNGHNYDPSSESTSTHKHDDRSPTKSSQLFDEIRANNTPTLTLQEGVYHNSDPAIPPTLTLPGYEATPSIEKLRLASYYTDLSHITGFTITRPGYGSIQWKGTVDLNGLDLDRIVKIEKGSVSVYYTTDDGNENDGGDVHDVEVELQGGLEGECVAGKDKGKFKAIIKPPVGQGLNKPAIITFYNIQPKQSKNTNTPSNISTTLAYETKLRNICQRSNAMFIDYNCIQGTWVFAVEHFSKYGLPDDEEEEGEREVCILYCYL